MASIQKARLRRSLCLGAAALVPLLLVSACSPSASGASSGHPRGAALSTAKMGSKGSTGVSSHIVLHSDTLVSGAEEQGLLIIDNNTEQPVLAGCLSIIEVQLTNSELPLVLHPTPFCTSGTVPVGITRLSFSLHASQTVCQVPNGAIANASFCKPLPPGTYSTQLYPGLNIPYPPVVTVHIVAKT